MAQVESGQRRPTDPRLLTLRQLSHPPFDATLTAGLNLIQVTASHADGRVATIAIEVAVDQIHCWPTSATAAGSQAGSRWHFYWQAAAGSTAAELRRDVTKPIPLPATLAMVTLPDEETIDPGAVTRLSEPLPLLPRARLQLRR